MLFGMKCADFENECVSRYAERTKSSNSPEELFLMLFWMKCADLENEGVYGYAERTKSSNSPKERQESQLELVSVPILSVP